MADPAPPASEMTAWEWPFDRAAVLRELESQASKSGKRALDRAMFSRDQFGGDPSRKRSALDRTVIVPSYSAWYHTDVVHDIERRACPDFFNGVHVGRNPRFYRDCREFMVNHYRRNPRKHLSLDACLEMMTGDVQGIRQVWEFLNEWGLINYLADLDHLPTFSVVSNRRALRELSEAETDDEEDPVVVQVSGHGRGSDIITPQRPFSSARSGFVPGSSWTTSETLDLINAINDHGDDWSKIAAHVGDGKRSREECVAHFLTLPVEGGSAPAIKAANGSADAGKVPLNPLADSSNPLLAQVSFLASLVPPRVVAAAAQGAVQALLEDDAFTREQLYTAVNDLDGASPSSHSIASGRRMGGGKQPAPHSGSGGSVAVEGMRTSSAGSEKVDADAFYRAACAVATAAAFGPDQSVLSLKSAAAAALGSAAIKARALIEKEDLLVEDLTAQVVAHQLKKLDVRMRYFEALEGIREQEHAVLEKSWQQLHADRMAVNEANRDVQRLREALKGYIKSAVAARDACLLATVKAERSVEEFISRAEADKRAACEEAVKMALADHVQRGGDAVTTAAATAVPVVPSVSPPPPVPIAVAAPPVNIDP